MFSTSLFDLLAGLAATALCVGSYAARTHRGLTFTAALGVALWSVHFALRGAWTPALLSGLMSLRVLAGAWVVHLSERQRLWATALAFALTLTGAALTWQGLVSVPSTLATLFVAWAGFNLHNLPLRKALFVGEGLWLVNGLVTGSAVAAGAAVLALAMNAWTLRGLLAAQERSGMPSR